MPSPPRLVSAFLCLVALAVPAPAQKQKPPKVPTILTVQAGLPGPDNSRRPRLGAWAPVYVVVQAGVEDVALDERVARVVRDRLEVREVARVGELVVDRHGGVAVCTGVG